MRILADLPFKSYPLKRLQRFHVLHSLFDIMLAYAYDYRLTKGQHNSESAWNLNKLSSTFSWFQVGRNLYSNKIFLFLFESLEKKTAKMYFHVSRFLKMQEKR